MTGEERVQAGFRTMAWIGIVEQLARTMAERTLKEVGLSYAEFSMLTHFSHGHPPEKTVTGIAADMQQTQPTVTKTVQKLVAKGLLRAAPNAADGRSRLLTLSAKGSQLHARAVTRLGPAIARALDGWSEEELASFFRQLDRLKIWLDANRG